MLHQSRPHSIASALDQAENTRMQPQFPDGSMDRLGDDFPRAGVGGMAAQHHRAARRQSRCRVTACGRKGQRKIRGAEHRNRADRTLDHADFGSRGGLAIRLRGINPAIQIIALADVIGEKPQLPGGAATLALQTRGGQAGFLRADCGDRIGAGLDLIGNRF